MTSWTCYKYAVRDALSVTAQTWCAYIHLLESRPRLVDRHTKNCHTSRGRLQLIGFHYSYGCIDVEIYTVGQVCLKWRLSFSPVPSRFRPRLSWLLSRPPARGCPRCSPPRPGSPMSKINISINIARITILDCGKELGNTRNNTVQQQEKTGKRHLAPVRGVMSVFS